MKKPSSLEQVLNPLWPDLLHPNSSTLRTALLQFLGSLENRASAVDRTSFKLMAFATAFTKFVVGAYCNATIYYEVLVRSQKLLLADPGSVHAFSKLCRMLVGEVSRDLKDSYALLTLQADMLQLTQKEIADIEYLYRSGSLFETVQEHPPEPPTEAPDYSPSHVTSLMVALATLVGAP